MRHAQHHRLVIPVAVLLAVSGCSGNAEIDSASTGLCDESKASTADVPAAAPADRPIAFTSDRSGSFDLWLMGSDGSDPVQLTTAPGVEGMPSWSPDGSRLVFAAVTDLDGRSDLCVINADGTGLHNLTDTAQVSEVAPSWSPDGDHIAFATWTTDEHEIHLMDSGGGDSRTIAGHGDWPSWSPNGDRLVFSTSRNSTDQDLWVMNRDGSDQSVLADEDRALSEPAWSPDGKNIAYVAPNGSPDADDPVKWNEDVFVTSTDGDPGRQVSTRKGNDHWPPAWSPDGRQLAFTADGPNNVGEIVVVDLSTLKLTPLTDSESHDMFPAWRR